MSTVKLLPTVRRSVLHLSLEYISLRRISTAEIIHILYR